MSDPVSYHSRLAESWSGRYLRPSFQSRIAVFGKAIAECAQAGQSWLDAGCGTGEIAEILKNTTGEVAAIDASPEMVKRCRVPARVAPVEQLPFPDETFDGVVCSSVLEYLEEPERALQEFARVLSPEGILLISVPNSRSILRTLQRITYSVARLPGYMEFSRNAYSTRQFDEELGKHGFVTQRIEHFGPISMGDRIAFGRTLRLHVARKNQAATAAP